MEIDINKIIEIFTEKVAIKEKESVMNLAEIFTMREYIAKLEGILKENNIDIV